MHRILQSRSGLGSTVREKRDQQSQGRKVQENEWGRMRREGKKKYLGVRERLGLIKVWSRGFYLSS